MLTFVAFAVLAAGPLNPPAGPVASSGRTLTEVEPRTPVQSLAGAPDTQFAITAPGNYYLTGPITGSPGKHAIQIAASDVVLDLNGFTIDGVPGSLDGILAGTIFVPRQNITIVNGTVRDFGGKGVNAQYAAGVRLERVHAIANGDVGIKAGNGISGPAGTVVWACVARENAGAGIHVESASVEGCSSLSNSGRGITALSSSVRGCVASLNTTEGFGGSGSIADCAAIANLSDGINFSGSVNACRASNNVGQGIEVAAGSVIENCRSSFNELDGFLLEDGAAIFWSTARDNGDDGIELRANTTARGNTSVANGRTNAQAANILVVNTGARVDENTTRQGPYGVRAVSGLNLIVRNCSASATIANFDLAPGNTWGEIISGGAMVGNVSPWANFALDASD